MKRYLRRASKKGGQATGFTSIEDRFIRDDVFRGNLEVQGWTYENIAQADRIAKGDHSAFDTHRTAPMAVCPSSTERSTSTDGVVHHSIARNRKTEGMYIALGNQRWPDEAQCGVVLRDSLFCI